MELEPCPFCGESAVPYHDAEDGGWGVICANQKCECNLDRYATRESAEKAWNTRAVPAPMFAENDSALIEQLRLRILALEAQVANTPPAGEQNMADLNAWIASKYAAD